MKLLQIGLIFGLLLIAAGCAKQGTGTLNVQGLAQAQAIAQNAQAFCLDSDQCVPAVGMLTSADYGGALSCSGSLIADDVFMTDSHCIPGDLQTGASCDQRVWVTFPELDPYVTEQVGCDQILLNSGVADNRPDYAFIRLKRKVTRPFLKVSHAGLEEGTQVQIIKMNPQDNRSLGYFESILCKAIQDSEMLPFVQFKDSPMLTLGDCPVVAGNSGAPILDSDGNVRGIIKTELDVNTISKHYADVLLTSVAEMAGGTNLACVTTPIDTTEVMISSNCLNYSPEVPSPSEMGNYLIPLMGETTRSNERIQGKLLTDLDSWKTSHLNKGSELENNLQWGLKQLPPTYPLLDGDQDRSTHVYFAATPACSSGSSSSAKTETINSPIWKALPGLNQYLQWDVKVRQTRNPLSMTLQSSRNDWKMNGVSLNLPACQPTRN